MLLELKNVCYTYNKDTSFSVNALENINLQIPEGQFVGVIGHTGSGKSTLIQHFNGLIRPTDGQVLYMGEDIWQEKYNLQALRSGVGLVFQYPENQLFETDVLTDVMFGPKNQKLSPEECRERAVNALHRVGLKDKYFSASPFDLSGGQKRRVAIAGVLALKPKYLVVDEPTAGLDPRGREELLSRVCELHKKKKVTLIFVSHKMEDVARIADRLIVMNHGELVIDAPPRKAFLEEAAIKEAGLDIPATVRLLTELKEKGFSVDTDAFTIDETAKRIARAIKERGRR